MREIQRLAAGILVTVLSGRNLTQTLQQTWRRHPRLSAQQRAAIQDICYGTLRHYGKLQAILEQLLHRPLQSEPVRCLLLAALYQLHFGKSALHAVVDHAVAVAPDLGEVAAKGLVNAVLRNFLRRRDALLHQADATEAGRYSYPQWWIDKLKLQYPDQYASILDAGNLHPPMTLRVNRGKTSLPDYVAELERCGMSATVIGESALKLDQPLPVDRLPGFGDGLVSVQDAGAQLAATLLDVEPGMRVLDACAAPGGKTAHLLEVAEMQLTALEIDTERLPRVRDNLDRLGLAARLLSGDAGEPQTWWDNVPFQRILADVPCTASGVVRRHPDIKWLRRESDIKQFATQQARLLDALWRTLASGGKLLYATCSVFREENADQAAAFVARHRDASRLPLALPGALGGQLLPDAQHDGFFYALFLKT